MSSHSTATALMAAYMPARLQPFVTVSYPVWGIENGHRVQLFRKGRNDVHFVLFVTALFTVMRHVVMNYFFTPIAQRYVHVEAGPKLPPNASQKAKERRAAAEAKKKDHAVSRFAEQGWGMLYCTFTEVTGLIILSRIPNPTSPEQLWATYPVTPLPWLTKLYYLVQLAWWFHQVYTLNTEKRRKDHWQMLFHHFVTITLLTLSYMGNYTRVGVVVHTLMDLCDILLPAAKLLRYLDFKTACDGMFVVFLLGWVCTRQVGLAMVTYSAAFKSPKYISWEWIPAKQHYNSGTLYAAFISLLSLLLVLCTIWFYMAIMVAVRVVQGKGAEDTRSDSEDDEEELGSDDLDFDSDSKLVEVKLNGNGNGNGAANGTTTARKNGYANGNANGNGLTHRH